MRLVAQRKVLRRCQRSPDPARRILRPLRELADATASHVLVPCMRLGEGCSLTLMLAFCACGHTRDEHRAGGACTHTNHDTRNDSAKAEVRAKARKLDEQCACTRYAPDARLTDSEDFIGKVLRKAKNREGWEFEWVEWQEAVQVLGIQLWRTAEKYDSRSHIRFRVYAYFELFNDAIDHIRSTRGRHGQHRVFDARVLDDWSGDGDGPAGLDQSDSLASTDAGDDPDHWATDFGGLLTEGDQPPVEDLGRAGGGDGDGDPGRGDRAGVRSAGRVGAAVAGARRAAPRRAFVDCDGCGWRSYVEPPNGVPEWSEPEECRGCGAKLGGGVA